MDDAAWRDLVLIGDTTSSVAFGDRVATSLADRLPAVAPISVSMDSSPEQVTRVGRECVELFLRFETRYGRGRGVVRLIEDDGALLAWTLSTALEELIGHPERRGANRERGGGDYSHVLPGANWADVRRWAVTYADHEPEVLVVGGGQAGLGVAARLGRLNVDTLVVDKWPRIGDNWRQRYHALALHNETWTCHLPYLEFPDSFPTFLPKDQLANWFEIYVEAMELNYWAGTSLASATRDPDGRWTATLSGGDGSERVIRPRHIVMATGVSGIPHVPHLPGIEDFGGEVLHTTEYVGGSGRAGQRVAVLGTGNSAHDVAQDLHRHGAEVTLLQRGPTTIVSLEPAGRLPSMVYHEGRSLEDVDLLAVSTPPPYSLDALKLITDRMRELDAELIGKLEAKGFQTDYGSDGGGMLTKYLHRGGGYYINVGCSDLIISGDVGLRQWSNVEGFTETGICFRDGSHLETELIVLATGYQPMGSAVARLFGRDVADRVGQIWGLDETGESANMWKRTPQPGLWFAAGALAACRQRSKYLALEIKADLLGLAGVRS